MSPIQARVAQARIEMLDEAGGRFARQPPEQHGNDQASGNEGELNDRRDRARARQIDMGVEPV